MPLSEEDLKQIDERFNSKIEDIQKNGTEALNLAVRLKKDLEGVASKDDLENLTTTIGELKTGLEGLADKGGAGGGKGTPPGKPNTTPELEKLQGQVDALTKVNQSMAEANVRAKKQAAIAEGMNGFKFVEGTNPDDYKPLLMEQIKHKEVEVDGHKDIVLYMTVEEKIAGSDQPLEKEVSANEGVKRFFDARPGLLQTNKQGGAGAGGGSPGDLDLNSLSYQDLMDDPVKLAAAQKADSKRVDQLRDAHDKKRREQRTARI